MTDPTSPYSPTTITNIPLAADEPLVTFHRLPTRFPSSTPSASIYQSVPPAHHVVSGGGSVSASAGAATGGDESSSVRSGAGTTKSGASGGSAATGTVTGFRNPWPSFAENGHKGPGAVIHARFLSRERKYVPIPTAKEELVEVVVPDWGWGKGSQAGRASGGGVAASNGGGRGEVEAEKGGGGGGKLGKDNPNATKLKATWIGHASWLVETGVKRRAPILTPSITLTTPDGEGPDGGMLLATRTLSLDDPLSPPSTAGGTDDGIVDGKAAEENGEKDSSASWKKEQERRKKQPKIDRGIRILLDPVFSARMSPVRFAGPKRFTPPPCALADLPDPIDVVVISHDHYDHLDAPTIRFLVERERKRDPRRTGRSILFLCGLGMGRHLQGMGVREEEIVELDWWEGVRVAVKGIKGAARIVATPSQHFSGRGVWDAGKALWCSWVVEEVGLGDDDDEGAAAATPTTPMATTAAAVAAAAREEAYGGSGRPKKLYFAGDTGYRSVTPAAADGNNPDALASLPRCPAFAEIGELYGPFDLSLLPIGCSSPRVFLSPVHAAPEDAVCMHKDLRSKRSVAMHYGTVRMPLSEQYEDVREPPRRWRECAEAEGLRWGEEAGVCKIGETVLV